MAKENKYQERRWRVPNKRATKYVDDLRSKVHTMGPKEGQPLTKSEAVFRSGYLQCQTDHAGIHKYKKALSEGKSKKEAAKIAATKGKKRA